MTRLAQFGLAAILGAACTFLGAATPASAWQDEVRGCADPGVLNRIAGRFSYQVRHVPNLPDVRIVDFIRVGQRRYVAASHGWPIARRYCHATALLSDGRRRRVWYLIESKMGFASIGQGVEFCVSGFDRWMVYDGGCRVLR